MRADLHIHTTASDGCWIPEQVIAGVLAEGIGLFALADHDSVGNVARAESLARQNGLAFLRGVEVSTTLDGGMFHILGYGIDINHLDLLSALGNNTAKLLETDNQDIRKLIELGYPIDYDDYVSYEYDRTRGGFKSYNFLLERGFCTGTRDFFENVRAKLGHEWPTFVHPAEAIALIRAAGGIPVLAHPHASLPGGFSEHGLELFRSLGVDGIECYSQYHDADMTARCAAWCQRYGMIVTGGSDYHGGFVGRQLGVPFVTTDDLQLGELVQSIVT
mgnify:FL=1